MAHPVKDIIRWLKTLPEDSCVGIDEEGLTLLCDEDPDAYYEIGGMPLEDEEEDEDDEWPDLSGSDKIRFVVLDEDKLCLSYSFEPWSVTVVATKASAMLGHILGAYPMDNSSSNMRPATRQDFEDFRVNLEQYPEDEFEIPKA